MAVDDRSSHALLVHIAGELGEVRGDMAGVLRSLEQVRREFKDKEDRLRKLERLRWIIYGSGGVCGIAFLDILRAVIRKLVG